MSKLNCWEFKKCGREPSGSKVEELGVCPAATLEEADGFCGGIKGGRACVYIAGTYCKGKVQKAYIHKKEECEKCDFYQGLIKEEGEEASMAKFVEHIKYNESEVR